MKGEYPEKLRLSMYFFLQAGNVIIVNKYSSEEIPKRLIDSAPAQLDLQRLNSVIKLFMRVTRSFTPGIRAFIFRRSGPESS